MLSNTHQRSRPQPGMDLLSQEESNHYICSFFFFLNSYVQGNCGGHCRFFRSTEPGNVNFQLSDSHIQDGSELTPTIYKKTGNLLTERPNEN